MELIPKEIHWGDGTLFKVYEKSILPKLGYLDTNNNEIVIEESLPDVGKVAILIHELIHLCDEQCVASGAYKKGLTEDQVTCLSTTLSLTLMNNKMIGDFEWIDIEKFIKDRY